MLTLKYLNTMRYNYIKDNPVFTSIIFNFVIMLRYMDLNDVYENLSDVNPTKKRRVLIVFDDMIADMESNEKLSPIVTELFSRRRNSICCLFLSYNLISKCIKL